MSVYSDIVTICATPRTLAISAVHGVDSGMALALALATTGSNQLLSIRNIYE